MGGEVKRFQPLVEAYRQKALQLGHEMKDLKIAVTGHTYIADTYQQAASYYFPFYKNYKEQVSQQLGKPKTFTEEMYKQLIAPEEALFVGSPSEIVEKILRQHEWFGHHRFLAQIDIGGLPFRQAAKSLELLATKVMPEVRKHLSQ